MQEDMPTEFQVSRRNLVAMGALAASAAGAIVGSVMMALAGNGNGDGNGNGNGNGNGRKDPHCFLKGTKVETADGGRKIEKLAVGDLLPTVFGGLSSIQWIGRYRFKKGDPTKPWIKDVLPIRIARSALSHNVPHADLYVTTTHALLIDGVLVAAGNLVNGSTIIRYDARELDELEFFHIKLERHDVIYAEGAPCETLLNVDENAVNFAEYLREYGSSETDEIPCTTVFRYGYRRSQIKSRFRSAISPLVDRRQTVDIIRDKLQARALALLRHPEQVL